MSRRPPARTSPRVRRPDSILRHEIDDALCAPSAQERVREATGKRGDSIAKEFLTDVKTLRAARPQAHRAGRGHRGLPGRPRDRHPDPQRGARHRDRLRAALQAPLLHGERHQRASRSRPEFLQHANEEQGHADQIAARIVQLGGEPNFTPEGLLTRSHAEYVEGETLVDMIKEDLVAERIAIDSYARDDPLPRRRRPHHPPDARGHPRDGGRARRRPRDPPRDDGREVGARRPSRYTTASTGLSVLNGATGS